MSEEEYKKLRESVQVLTIIVAVMIGFHLVGALYWYMKFHDSIFYTINDGLELFGWLMLLVIIAIGMEPLFKKK